MSQAYKDVDKMDIVDKLNKIGNNFSISTDELATGLQNSAAALSVAGNSLDESVALITAGNAITQDASRTGNGLRMIALRMTGTEEAKAEAEAMGEDVSDFVVQTQSKIDQQLRDYTAVASNNFKGVSLLDENGNYRSTYQVLQDIADIYDEIVETDKQFGTNKMNGLLELIAGKSRSNIAASVLQNGDMLRSVYQQSQNAEGSALEENEKHLDSIDGKIQQLQNRLQEFAATVIDSDMFKGLIDGATQLLELLNSLISTIGVLPTALGGVGIVKGALSIPDIMKIGAENIAIKDIKKLDKKGQAKELAKIFNANEGERFSDISGVKAFGQKHGFGEDVLRDASMLATSNSALTNSMKFADGIGEGLKGASNFADMADDLDDVRLALLDVAQAGEEIETVGAEVAMIGEGAAASAGGVGILSTAFAGLKAAAASLWGAIAPLWPLLAGGALLAGAAIWANWEDHRYDREKEDATTAIEKSDKSTSELEDTNTKLGEIDNKIAEIQSKGKLSLTDEADLANLKAQKDELEALKTIQEETAKNDKAAANKESIEALKVDNAVKDLTTKYIDNGAGGTYKTTTRYDKNSLVETAKNETKQLNELKETRTNLQNQLSKAVEDNDKDLQKNLKNQIDANDKEITQYKKSLIDIYDQIKELQQGLDPNDTENGGQKWFNKTQSAMDDIIYAIDENKTPIGRMQKTINDAFKGNDKQAAKFGDSIEKYITKAVEGGKTAQEGLRELGLTMRDVGFDWKNMSDLDKNLAVKSLNQYFKDLAKSATKAKDAIKDIKPTVDGTFEGVQKAQESANAGANWESLSGWFKNAKELKEKGLVGTDDFQTIAQFMAPKKINTKGFEFASDAYIKAWDDNVKKFQRYFDSENPYDSMDNFINDAIEKGVMHRDKNNSDIIRDDFKTTAEAAKKMGLSVEATETILSRLKDYGFKFEGITKSSEQLKDYKENLDSLKTVYEEMPEGEERDLLGTKIKGFNEQYAQYEQDMSQLDKEAIVHIKFEYDLAQLQKDIEDSEESITNEGWDLEKASKRSSELSDYISTAEKETGVNRKNNAGYNQTYEQIESIDATLRKGGLEKSQREDLVMQKEAIQYMQKGYQDMLRQGASIDWGTYVAQNMGTILDTIPGLTDEVRSNIEKSMASAGSAEGDKTETKENLLPFNDREKNRRYYNEHKDDWTDEMREGYERQWADGKKGSGVNKLGNLVDNVEESDARIEDNQKLINSYLDMANSGKDATKQMNDLKEAADKQGKSVKDLVKQYGGGKKGLEKFETAQKNAEETTKNLAKSNGDAAKDVTDTVSTMTPGAKSIEVKVDKEKLNQELSSIDTNQSITYKAEVDGAKAEVEAIKNEDGTITYIADIGGVKQEVDEVKEEDGTVSYTAKGLGEVQQQAKNAANVDGKVTITGDTQDKNLSVTANASNAMTAINQVNSKKIKNKKFTISANAGGAISAVRNVANAVSSLPSSKTVTLTTNKVTNVITHKKSGAQEAYGTVAGRSRGSIAYAHGSIGAYANGKLPLSSSFIKNNSIRQNETALVNEVGREGIVRNGRVMTVNGGRPGFTQLRKNDVVLNHRDMAQYEQTGTLPYADDNQGIVRGNQFTETSERPRRGDIVFSPDQLRELEEKGRISTYARIVGGESAFAGGTYEDVDIDDLDYVDEYDDEDEEAYAKGSIHAYAGRWGKKSSSTSKKKSSSKSKSSGGGKKKSKSSKGKTKSKKKSKKKYSANDEFSKWLEKLFDWVEVTMDRLNRVTEKAKTMADNAQTLADGLKYTQQAISGTVNELKGAENAQKTYAAQATKVRDQSRAYAKKQNEARKKNKKIAKAAGMSAADEKKLQQQIKNNTFSIASFGKYRKSYIEAYKEWYEKSLDMAQKQLELEEQLRELYRQRLSVITEWYDRIGESLGSRASANEAYVEMQKANGNYVSGNETAFDNRNKALTQAVANSQKEYSDYLDEFQSQIRSGRIVKGEKDYYDALNTLNGLEENIYKDNQALAEFRKELVDISFDNLKNAIDTLSSSIDLLTARNEHAENYGNRIGSTYELTANSYQEVINRNVEQAAQYLKQYTDALAEQQKYEIGSEQWLEYREKAAEAGKEVYSIRDGIIDLANSMREVRWKNFSKDVEVLERTSSELEDIRDLLNEDNLIAKNGSFTPEGLANVALLGKEIKNVNQQIQRHRAAIEYLNEEYNNGVITLDELTEGVNDHQDSIIDLAKNVADYRQNVLDSYLDSLEKQNDLLNENISKRKEALDTMRDYYNYQRQVYDQTRNINYLEQQIMALQGTNDKSSRAKLASLQNELQAARRDFADSQYEHEMDVRSEGYDKLADDANEALDRLTDDIKRSTELQNQIIDNMLNLAQESYSSAYEQINEIIKRHGIILSETTQTTLENKEVQGEYFGDVTNKAKAFGEAVDVDTSSIAGLVEGMESAKDAFLAQGDSMDVATKKAQAMSGAYQQLIKDVNDLATSEGNYNTGNPTKDQASVSELDDGGSVTDEKLYNGQAVVEGTNPTPKAPASKPAAKKTPTKAQLKKTATDYIKKYGKKGNKKTKYGEFNTTLFKKKGLVLDADHRKALAKKLGITYNNDKKTGNLYKKLKSIGYFAKGSKYIPFDQLGVTQEKGQELVYKRADGTILTPLGKGDKVFTADMTDNLWKLAKMNTDAIKNNINGGTNNTINNKPTINLTFDNFINVEGNLDQDAVADLRQFKDEIIRDFTKQLTNDFGMFGHKLKF